MRWMGFSTSQSPAEVMCSVSRSHTDRSCSEIRDRQEPLLPPIDAASRYQAACGSHCSPQPQEWVTGTSLSKQRGAASPITMHSTIGNLNATTIAATQLLGSSANDLAESHDSDRGLSRVHGEDNRYLPLGNMLPRPPASACSLPQSFPWCGWSCSLTEFQQRRRGPGRDSEH